MACMLGTQNLDDEATKLQKMVARSLEASGVLGKIRAELRANVYKAMEQEDLCVKPLAEKDSLHSTSVALILDWLECTKCKFSLRTFTRESRAERNSRKELCASLGMGGSHGLETPVLHLILEDRLRSRPNTPTPPSKLASESLLPSPPTLGTATRSGQSVEKNVRQKQNDTHHAHTPSSSSAASPHEAKETPTFEKSEGLSLDESKISSLNIEKSDGATFSTGNDLDALDALSLMKDKTSITKAGFTDRKEGGSSSLWDLPPLPGIRGRSPPNEPSSFLSSIDPDLSTPNDDEIKEDRRKADEIKRMINDPDHWKTNRTRDDNVLAPRDDTDHTRAPNDTIVNVQRGTVDEDEVPEDFGDLSVGGESSDHYYAPQNETLEGSGCTESNAFETTFGPDISVDSQELERCDHFEPVSR